MQGHNDVNVGFVGVPEKKEEGGVPLLIWSDCVDFIKVE